MLVLIGWGDGKEEVRGEVEEEEVERGDAVEVVVVEEGGSAVEEGVAVEEGGAVEEGVAVEERGAVEGEVAIKKNIKSQLNIRDGADDTIYHTDLQNEVLQWRAQIREADYFISPHSPKDHTSLSNKSLDPDLVNFSQKCKNHRLRYIQEASKINSVKVSLSLEPIFFTSFDKTHYHAIENKTKAEIASIINENIQKLLDLDYEAGEDMRLKWLKEFKNGSKNLYIKFYKDLTELLENAFGCD
ncbi:uncharacterized protein LOC134270512 [Saccostrea cucullata]|uniref:uncharacterized protein LOC134270512 n=1 Tax=Saccostrea cuccullata TaxID=36930 RepID=UPI002ED09906